MPKNQKIKKILNSFNDVHKKIVKKFIIIFN